MASWKAPIAVTNHGMPFLLFVRRYWRSSLLMPAEATWAGSSGLMGSRVTTSGLLKRAIAAVASCLRITLRVFGRNTRDLYLYASLAYLLSRGCWELKRRRPSSH